MVSLRRLLRHLKQASHAHVWLHVVVGVRIVGFNGRGRLICFIDLLLKSRLLNAVGCCNICIDDGYIIHGHGRLGAQSASLAHSASVPAQSLAWCGQAETLQNV